LKFSQMDPVTPTAADPPRAAAPPGALDRALGILTRVETGEGVTAILLAAGLFLLLTSSYLVKPVREALILSVPGGAELKAYASAGSALVFLAAVPLYGALAGRWPRNRLIAGVTGFFCACLLGFYVLGSQPSLRGALGVPFYLWASVFSMMVVAQSWAFANDVLSAEQGRRLFAVVGLGASLGAVLGSKLTGLLLKPPGWAPWPALDVFALLPVAALLLGATALLTESVHRRVLREAAGRHDDAAAPLPAFAPPPSTASAFRLVLSERYLSLLAAFSLLFTCVNSNGEYILGKLVAITGAALPEAERSGFIAGFYADFYFWVNSCALLLQALGVSRIVRLGGVRAAFLVLPALVLASSSLVALWPVLAVLRFAKIAENASDYSLNNTVRHMLWLPTTTEMKYKAKMAVDTLMVRLGDVSTSLCVLAGTAGLEALGLSALGVRGFATLNLVLGLGWLVLAGAIVREHGRRQASVTTQR
jgi:AAA family ATP:ADP antiporter